jgi:hypothetical protein
MQVGDKREVIRNPVNDLRRMVAMQRIINVLIFEQFRELAADYERIRQQNHVLRSQIPSDGKGEEWLK